MDLEDRGCPSLRAAPVRREAWPSLLQLARGLGSWAVVRVLPLAPRPSVYSVSPGTLTEHAGLELYKMVSDNSWPPGALSLGEEKLINKYAERKWCVSPRLEWSGGVSEEVVLLCVLKEVQGLAEQNNACCIFLSQQQGKKTLLQAARMQSRAYLNAFCWLALWTVVATALVLRGPSPLSLSCSRSLPGCLQPTLGAPLPELL